MDFTIEQLRRMMEASDRVKVIDETTSWLAGHMLVNGERDGQAIRQHYGQNVMSLLSNGELGNVVGSAIINYLLRQRGQLVADNPFIVFPAPPPLRGR